MNRRLASIETIFRSLPRFVVRPPESAPLTPHVPVMLIDELRIDWFNGWNQFLVQIFERFFPMVFDGGPFGDLDEWTCVNCADYVEAVPSPNFMKQGNRLDGERVAKTPVRMVAAVSSPGGASTRSRASPGFPSASRNAPCRRGCTIGA